MTPIPLNQIKAWAVLNIFKNVSLQSLSQLFFQMLWNIWMIISHLPQMHKNRFGRKNDDFVVRQFYSCFIFFVRKQANGGNRQQVALSDDVFFFSFRILKGISNAFL